MSLLPHQQKRIDDLKELLTLVNEALFAIERTSIVTTEPLDKQRYEQQILEKKNLRIEYENALRDLGVNPKDFLIPFKPCNPYRGLESFRFEDRINFFGRENVSEELKKLVEQYRFIALIGASGSGKSSILHAGLRGKLDDSWLVLNCRPSINPFKELSLCINNLNYSGVEKYEQFIKLSELLSSDKIALIDILEDIRQEHKKSKLLLIVDQFEELYSTNLNELIRNSFIKILKNLLEKTTQFSPLKLLLSYRADFTEFVMEDFSNCLNEEGKLFLSRMNKAELYDVIEQPAFNSGVYLEGGLLQRIIADVGVEAGRLPLLQFALFELWDKQENRYLTHKSYEEIGGIERALANYADDVFKKFNKVEEQDSIRKIFMELVRFGDEKETTRQIVTKSQLQPYWDLVNQLATQRLVITQKDEITGQETVELVHEALIKHWSVLCNWIEANREFKTWQGNLRRYIKDKALLRDGRLIVAQEWLKLKETELQLEEKLFIEESAIAFENEVAEKEKQNLLVKENLDKALRTQSLFLADLARQEIEKGNAVNGILLALEALPKDANIPDRPYCIEAEEQLYNAIANIHEYLVLQHSECESVEQAIVSHDEKTIATISGGITEFKNNCETKFTIKLWDSTSGTLKKCITGHQAKLNSIAFSLDDRYVLTTSDDKTARLWEVETAKQIAILEHDDIVNNAIFHPIVNNYIVTASDDKTIIFWRILEKKQDKIIFNQQVKQILFSPNGVFLAVLTRNYSNGVAYLINLENGNSYGLIHDNNEYSCHISFSPNNQYISVTDTQAVYIWSTNNFKFFKKIEVEYDNIQCSVFNKDSTSILVKSYQGGTNVCSSSCILFDLNTDKQKEIKIPNYIDNAIFSKNGLEVITTTQNKIIIYDINLYEKASFIGHDKEINNIYCFNDDNKILTSSTDGTIRIWKIENAHIPINEFQINAIDSSTEIAFSADNKRLIIASISIDFNIENAQVWDIETREQTVLETDDKKQFLNTVERNKVLREKYTSEIERHFEGNTVFIFSDSTSQKAIVSKFKDISYLWDIEKGKPLGILYNAGDNYFWVAYAAFSLDKKYIATIQTNNNIISIWKAFQTTQDLINYANKIVPRSLTQAQKKKFFLIFED